MKLTDKQKTLGLFVLHFLPALPFVVVGSLISWQEGGTLIRAYGPPSWNGVKDLLLTVVFFVIIPSLAVIAAYVFCTRIRKRVHRGFLLYGTWLVLGAAFSFMGAISCEGTSMGVGSGSLHPLKLFKELSFVTFFFLAWFHLFIIPWTLLFAYAMKRFPWLFARPSVEARIITSVPYDRPGVTTPGALPRPWKKRRS